MNESDLEPIPVINKIYFTVGSLVVLAAMFAVSQYNFLLFHGLAEIFSIVVAWSLFLLVFNTRKIARNDALLFLGIAYLFIGLIDLIHTLSFKDMGIFPNYLGANYATQLWIAARGMEAISLLVFPLLISKRIRFWFVVGVYTAITALLIVSIFSWSVFPDCFIDGQGLTTFKKVAEYIISLTFIVSIALLYRIRSQLDTHVFRLMVGAIIITIAGELAFTFYVSVFGLSNVIGHFFKISSFFLIYLALVRSTLTQPYTTLFKTLEMEKRALKESEFFFKESQNAALIGSYQAEFYPNDLWESSDVCDEIFGIDITYEKSIKGWTELIHPDFAEEMIRYVKDDVIGQGIFFNKEYKIVRPSDNETRWVLGLGEAIKDETGRTTGLIGTIQDITERKKIEEALLESERKFRALFELSPVGMVMIDPETGVFLEVNNAVLKSTGYTKSELLELSFQDITPKGYEQQDLEQIENLIRTGQFGPYEKELIRKDGNRYPIRIRSFLITKPRGQRVIWGIIEDLSEIKMAEEETHKLQLQLNHKSKMDAIGELAGGMAHDFNNVLSGILSASQLLKLPKQELNENSLKYVNTIIHASMRASDLISKLLAFSRKGNTVTSTYDIHKILDDTVDILEGTIDKKITLEVKKESQRSKIAGDFSALESAFINLGINASHAMPDGGVIQIKTQNIFLDQQYCDSSSFEIVPGDFLQIDVKDIGCGIPNEKLEKIFEPFYTTKEQGSGLGLSAVYGTIQDHHGIIEVQSKVGAGTTFRIYLPSSSEEIEKVKKKANVVTGAGTILVVDDEEMNRILNTDILESLGYEVLTAEDGLESIDIFREKHSEIDIVLMDMIMPKMSGSEAFYKMKEIDDKCKVIISSGFTQDENIDTLLKNGLAGFINKPYKISEISRLLDRVNIER